MAGRMAALACRERCRTGHGPRRFFTGCDHVGSEKCLCPARAQRMRHVYELLRSYAKMNGRRARFCRNLVLTGVWPRIESTVETTSRPGGKKQCQILEFAERLCGLVDIRNLQYERHLKITITSFRAGDRLRV